MTEFIKQFVWDSITGPDGKTIDPARWLGILTVLSYLAGAMYVAFSTEKFDLQNFGIGAAAVLGAFGAAVAFKAGTEPRGREPWTEAQRNAIKPPVQ